MSSSSPLSSSPPADPADAAVFDFADNPQCAVGQEHMNMCVCVCVYAFTSTGSSNSEHPAILVRTILARIEFMSVDTATQ